MSRKVAPGQCWPDLGWPLAPLGTRGPFRGAGVGVAEPGVGAGQQPPLCLSLRQVPSKGPRKAAPAGQADIFLPARQPHARRPRQRPHWRVPGSMRGSCSHQVARPWGTGAACHPPKGFGRRLRPARGRCPQPRAPGSPPRRAPPAAPRAPVFQGVQPPGAKPGTLHLTRPPARRDPGVGGGARGGHSLLPGAQARERGRQW